MTSNITSHRRMSNLRTRRIYFIAAFITLALLVVGVAFISYSSEVNKNNTAEQIQQATQTTKAEIEEHIYSEFRTLQAVAMFPSDRELLDEDDVWNRLVTRLLVYKSYIQIGLIDADGNALVMDKSGITRTNIKGELYVEAALSGKILITPTLRDKRLDIEVNYYFVPVYDELTNEQVGALFVADTQERFDTIISHSLYAGIGFIHIIDSEGNFVLRSNSPLSLATGDNLFSGGAEIGKDQEASLLNHFRERTSGQTHISVSGNDRLVSYEPLSVNDWLVLYSIPAESVSPEISSTAVGTTIIIGVTALVFVFFMLLLNHAERQSRQELEDIAFVDPVTGGSNYQKFLADAAILLKKNGAHCYGICYCDTKDFKYINELFGRDTGDALLKYFWDAIDKTIYPGELFARVFADTFVILFKNDKKMSSIHSRFKSVAQLLEVFPPTFHKGYKIELFGGVYFGNNTGQSKSSDAFDDLSSENTEASLDEKFDNLPECPSNTDDSLTPVDLDYVTSGRDAEKITIMDMIDRANTALKTTQSSNTGEHLGFYSEEMRQQKLWESELASKMDAALENDEFVFYLQPKISLHDYGKVVGAEALVRWISPEHGLVPPGDFISLFERNGFIINLDRYIFEQACKFYKETVIDVNMPRYILSINVSRRQLKQADFVASYAEIKNKYKIPDGCIELEFTESLIFENLSLFKDVTAMCKGVGFFCSLDDFGSGYSTLNVLKHLDVDVIKLDRLFFSSPTNHERGRILVGNIIKLAQELNMKTVAEGIEDTWQAEELQKMGCDMVQGYVFSQPLPPNEFLEFIKNRQE